MSKTGLYKLYAYSITIAGSGFGIYRMMAMPTPDASVALVLFGIVLLFFFIPSVVFGASVQPGEKTLKVGQYRDVELDYKEIYRCYRYVFPPFEMAIIVTRRPLPLRILVASNGTIGKRGNLLETVRTRIDRTA
ncbi:MAG TPA: hypothetical protein VGK21_00170 [Candidatus Angelobacter sp.]|jgi:hypothetical protein